MVSLLFVIFLSSFYWKILFKKTIDPDIDRKFKDRLNRFQNMWNDEADEGNDPAVAGGINKYPASLEMSHYRADVSGTKGTVTDDSKGFQLDSTESEESDESTTTRGWGSTSTSS